MTEMRTINLSGEQAGQGNYWLTGFVDATTRVLSGTLNFMPADGSAAVTVAVTGTSTGSDPEDLPITSQDTATLNVVGTAQIQLDGSAVGSLTGTLPSGDAASVTLTGAISQFPVQYRQPQPAGDGLEIFEGVTIDNPCLLLNHLRAAKLKLITGQQKTRIEFNGRSLYFERANLVELDKAIAKYAALCTASGGTDPEATVPRTRRQIRVNPYC